MSAPRSRRSTADRFAKSRLETSRLEESRLEESRLENSRSAKSRLEKSRRAVSGSRESDERRSGALSLSLRSASGVKSRPLAPPMRSANLRLSASLEIEGRSIVGPGREKSLRLCARPPPAPLHERTSIPPLDGARTVPPPRTAALPPAPMAGPALRTLPPLRKLAPPPARILPPALRALILPPPLPPPPPPRFCAHSEPADNSATSATLVAIFNCLYMIKVLSSDAARTFPPAPTRACGRAPRRSYAPALRAATVRKTHLLFQSYAFRMPRN
jgi:hypothetical protein